MMSPLFLALLLMLFKFSRLQNCIEFEKKYHNLNPCYNYLTVDLKDGKCRKNRNTHEVIMVSLIKSYFTHKCQYSRTKPDLEALRCGSNLTSIEKLEFIECELSEFKMKEYASEKEIKEIVINDKLYRNIKMFFDIPSLQIITLLYTSSRKMVDMRFDQSLRLLRVFTMYRYRVKGFPSSPFTNLTSLQMLVLTYGTLDRLDSNFFKGLGDLKVLNLTGNQIGVVQKKAFSDLTKLEELTLERNKIKQFPENLFNDVPSLRVLNIGNNTQVNQIPQEYFRNAGSLKVLIVSFCGLRFIRNKAFSISSLVGSQLEVLDLSHNKLISIEEGSFGNLHRLKKLDISHNPITIFRPVRPFGRGTYFEEIIANNCNLTEMPTIDLSRGLMKLDFSFNHITYVNLPTTGSSNTEVLLNDNAIAIIDVSFDSAYREKPKYILRNNNPRCNCHTKTFLEFVHTSNRDIFPDVDSLMCRGTDDVKVTSVGVASMKCPFYCPLDCYCEGEIVHCKSVQLTAPPFPLPPLAKVLHLQKNNIDSLSTIDPGYWENITHLYASKNALQSLGDWDIPPGLTEMHVDGNRLKAIPPSLMKKVEETAGLKISLANNEWKCDCDFVGLKNWFTRNKPKIRDANITVCVLPSTDVGVISDISLDCFCGTSAGTDGFLVSLIIILIILVLTDFGYAHRTRIMLWIHQRGILHPNFTNKNATGRIHPMETMPS